MSKIIKLSSIHLNDGTHGLPKNPRFIKDEKFRKLCESIRDNPEFMPARPIITDEDGVILGGNMRFRACEFLRMTEIPADWVQMVDGWTVEKKRRFIILDNRSYGSDDFELLGNEWEISELLAAGMLLEELGDVEDEHQTPEEKTEDLRAMKKMHLLISMTADQGMELLPKIEALVNAAGAEVHHAGN